MQPDLPSQTPTPQAKEDPQFETASFNLNRLGGHTMQDVAQEIGEAFEKAVRWLFSRTKQISGMAMRGGAAIASSAPSLIPSSDGERDRGESTQPKIGRSQEIERSPSKELGRNVGISTPSRTIGDDCSLDDLGHMKPDSCPSVAKSPSEELPFKRKTTHEH